MRWGKYLWTAALCLATVAAFGATESEPNNDRASADGPISFPETLTGQFFNDGGAIQEDYWSFSATAGSTYTFVGSLNTNLGGGDIALDLENSAGGVLASEDENFGMDAETLEWTATAAGTYYLVVWNASGTPDGIANWSVNCSVSTGDSTPPAWSGSNIGLDTAIRQISGTSVDLTWFQANDDVTPLNEIKYQIFYDTVEANVFAAGPKTMVTGSLTTTINGLAAGSTYYFAVRAEDASGNRETNTVIQTVPPVSSVSDWRAR